MVLKQRPTNEIDGLVKTLQAIGSRRKDAGIPDKKTLILTYAAVVGRDNVSIEELRKICGNERPANTKKTADDYSVARKKCNATSKPQ